MDFTLFVILLFLQSALYTHQARTRKRPSLSWTPPPHHITAAASSSNGEDSFVSLVKKRPGKNQDSAHKQYKKDFANHPDIIKLNSLSGDYEDYTNYALSLQNKLAEEEGRVKVKFTKAIQAHMAHTDVFTEKDRIKIKARLRQMTRTQNKEKQRAIKYGREDGKGRMRSSRSDKGRTTEEVKADPRIFERLLRNEAGVTDEMTAFDVEEASRRFIQNNHVDTRKLKMYLQARYPPHEVKSAIASRSMYLGQKDTRNQSKKRRAANRASSSGVKTVDSQDEAVVKKAGRKCRKTKQGSSLHSTVQGEVEVDNLEDTEWWDDCFN